MVLLSWHEKAFRKIYCQEIRPRLLEHKRLKYVGGIGNGMMEGKGLDGILRLRSRRLNSYDERKL